ncbi:MAG: hypothetical protein JJ992_05820, partial [Planctomycetes bacterium]|nr:hypothetical protein [Planctomycetota bacterium]
PFSYEARWDEDPLQVADRLGRPMAILRIGSRTPEYDSVSQRFTFDSPPFVRLTRPARLPDRRSGLEESPPGADGSGRFPRLPKPGDTSAWQGRGFETGSWLR